MRKRVGQYNIQQPNHPIGHGQSAAVYLATHVDAAQEVVALKFFHVFAPEKRVQRIFLRETQIITRLDHPNIIRVLHVGFDKNNPYYVMSYAPGGNLKSKIKPGSPMSPEDVDVYLQQIANAIQHVHDSGLVHCDLKPENILIAADGALLLADFGITRSIQTIQAQSTQGAAGTPLYMAPEQFIGKPDTASDQYGLGVMAYELLAGGTPFTGSNAVELMGPHLQDSPPPLTAKNPAVSPGLEAVIFRALEKKPEDRFPSVLDFAKSFHEAIYGAAEAPPAAEGHTTISDESIEWLMLAEELAIRRRVIGEQLRKERKLRGWSQRSLADLMDLSLSTISRWERGEILPDIHNRVRLAEIFDKKVQKLFPEALISLDAEKSQSSNTHSSADQPTQDNPGLYANETRIMVPGLPDSITVHNKQNSDVDPSIIGNLLKTPEGYKDAGPHSPEYYSCLILYSDQDQDFAIRLYVDLEDNGMKCWFAPIDMSAGDHTRDLTHKVMNQSNRILLVLSERSLESDKVGFEVETALEMEHQKQRYILLPIYLDDSIMATSKSWALTVRGTHSLGDFTGWKTDSNYQRSLNRLLRDLKPQPAQESSYSPPQPLPQYQSCMIAYSSKDAVIAEKLLTDLQKHGVLCWFAPEDLKTGGKLLDHVERTAPLYDRLLLILSEDSISRVWVESQVRAIWQREHFQKEKILLPVSIDYANRLSHIPWVDRVILEQHVFDLTRWEDPIEYEKSLESILRDLRRLFYRI